MVAVQLFFVRYVIQISQQNSNCFGKGGRMASKNEEQIKTNGRWNKEEHQRFVLGLHLYGKDWKRIQALIGTRNGAQIRSHAQKYFIKLKKEAETHEHPEIWEQTKQTPPEELGSLPHPSSEPQTRPEYSYYLNKIVEQDALKDSFDFWSSLVDLKSLSFLEWSQGTQRKSSFVSVGQEREQEADGHAPSKKVKCE